MRLTNLFVTHFFRFLAAVRSTRPKIDKPAKFSLRIFFDFWRRCTARCQKSKKVLSFRFAFFSIFGGGAQHAANKRKKCFRFVSHFFRFLAAVRSTPPKIEKNVFVSFRFIQNNFLINVWGSNHLIETVGPRPAAGAAEPGPTVSIKC